MKTSDIISSLFPLLPLLLLVVLPAFFAFPGGKFGKSFKKLFRRHFKRGAFTDLVTTVRTFPMTARPDLQNALDGLFKTEYLTAKLVGVNPRFAQGTVTIPSLVSNDMVSLSCTIAPLQSDDVEIGGDVSVRCLKNALWLASAGQLPFALLLSPITGVRGQSGIQLEIAVMPGEESLAFSRSFFELLEKRVQSGGSYRGKILSLEKSEGQTTSIQVHQLRSVTRNQVILPEKTLKLLDHNVMDFIKFRPQLKELKMPAKKGLLFYGQPGTGKTHTIHYLASQLPDHTTFVISGEQVGQFDEYIQLARFLQPAVIVIEDADLMAGSREKMESLGRESLLNKLLNEMDGLREDAEILFILTTNRPETLEPALTARPGRIDQAIEFPLPDDDARRKLIALYAGNLQISDELVSILVQKTSQTSGAFIKELMRRCGQYVIQSGDGKNLATKQLNDAFDEMLVSGGSLNRKLLGGSDAVGFGFTK